MRTCRERNRALRPALCDVAITDISLLIQIAFRYEGVSRRGRNRSPAPPRAAIIQRSRTRYGLSVTHRPTCRVSARPRRIKNSRCNDRYFSTGHRGCVLSNGNGLAKRKSVGRKVISLDGRGCKADKNYGRADCVRTRICLPVYTLYYRFAFNVS